MIGLSAFLLLVPAVGSRFGSLLHSMASMPVSSSDIPLPAYKQFYQHTVTKITMVFPTCFCREKYFICHFIAFVIEFLASFQIRELPFSNLSVSELNFRELSVSKLSESKLSFSKSSVSELSFSELHLSKFYRHKKITQDFFVAIEKKRS
jgi:hypothetical protein